MAKLEQSEFRDKEYINTLVNQKTKSVSVGAFKKQRGSVEIKTREKLNRRYDLCNYTFVYIYKLKTALDNKVRIRWS